MDLGSCYETSSKQWKTKRRNYLVSLQYLGEVKEELLNIGFGGAFSTDTGYTNATGEVMDGKILRRTGEEQLDVKLGVTLPGDFSGIDFYPRVSLGEETIDQPLFIEFTFTPQLEQEQESTILSVGGSLFIRYSSPTTIEYGFDVKRNNQWETYKESAVAPKTDVVHEIVVIYNPINEGATLRVFLNGNELPSVSTEKGKAELFDSIICFGNEVHRSALNRGVRGAFSKVTVSKFDGSIDTQQTSQERNVFVIWEGNVYENTYSPSEGELISGTFEINGGTLSEDSLLLNGNGSYILYKPNVSLIEQGKIKGNYFTELVFDPIEIKDGSILIDFAGAIIIRHAINEKGIDIIVNGEVHSTIPLIDSLLNKPIHLTFLYQHVKEEAAKISIWLQDEPLVEDITLDQKPQALYDKIVFAGNAFENNEESLTGKIYGIAITSFQGNFNTTLLALQGLPRKVTTQLEPSYCIPIYPNETPKSIAKKASLVRPRPKQVTWQKYEQTAFLHYGINTYYGVEWGNFNEDPNMFQPTELDTDQWARTLKESGFKLAILTVKHHDGFVLYPTRYTKFSVASSSWRNGNGDVLREFVDSMRKYGLKVGIYLSPADHHAFTEGIFANGSPRRERVIPTLVEGDDRRGNPDLPTFTLPATDYGEMFLNQLYEVLTEYGPIDEVWFDGAQGHIPGDKKEHYDWDSYYKLINALQPDAVIAITGDDVRWVGNESGWAREDEWSVLAVDREENGRLNYYPEFWSPDLGSRDVLVSAAQQGMKYLTWWPAEVDVSIRQGWFYHEDQQPKSVEELRNIYYQSIARNSVLLLNIPPDKRGKIADIDVQRLKEWHASIQRDFAINHAKKATIHVENGAPDSNPYHLIDDIYENSWQSASTEPSCITFTFEDMVTVDKVVLQENINYGQQVEAFAIDMKNSNGDWEEIAAAGTIGYKRIVLLPNEVTSSAFRIRILQSRGPVHLSTVGLYQTGIEE